MRKYFKYRLFTNKTQEIRLNGLFDSARFLYNCALEHRIVCYKQWKKSVTYYNQANTLKEIRSFDDGLVQLNYCCSQNVLRQLDKAFQDFFRRVKRGGAPGFPRFKSKDRFHSITFPAYGNGVKLKNKKLYIQNVGHVRIKLHRILQGRIKTVAIKKRNGHFYVSFCCDRVPINKPLISTKQVGIDVGIKSFAVMSNGQVVDNPKHMKQLETKLNELQRQYSKKCSHKTKRNLLRLHGRVANQRKDFLHKLSRKIVNEFGFVFVEDLKPQKMVNGNIKVLNRYINDAAWSQFFGYISYKAEWAGRVFVKVDPKGTTQECSNCGEIVPKDLSVRIHDCPKCGLKVSRDYNASLNILRRGQRLVSMTEAVC